MPVLPNPRQKAEHILVIAGTDSSGGAGLTRDTAAATTLGFGVCPIVTAVTVQTDHHLSSVHPIPPDTVAAQIRAACKAACPAAVKIGMIGSIASAREIAAALPPGLPVVLDPVLKSSSGGQLMPAAAIAPILERSNLLLTPNLQESAALTERPQSEELKELETQAKHLLARGACAVLIKGGHGTSRESIDHLFHADGSHQTFRAARLARTKRGTGCTLSTNIACYRALGHGWQDACARAKTDLTRWLSS